MFDFGQFSTEIHYFLIQALDAIDRAERRIRKLDHMRQSKLFGHLNEGAPWPLGGVEDPSYLLLSNVSPESML